MTRETKIGLLVGLAFIIVIGILLSDHMSSTTEPEKASLGMAGGSVREAVATPNGLDPVAGMAPTPVDAPRSPVATRSDLNPPRQPLEEVGVGPARGSAAPISINQRGSAPVAVAPVPNDPPVVAVGPGGAIEAPPVAPAPHSNKSRPIPNDLVAQHPEDLALVGNAPPSKGSSKAPAATPPVTAPRQYTAEPGDSVSRIASRLMGGNTKANRDALIKANPSLQKEGAVVYVGRNYVIPSAGAAAQSGSAPTPPAGVETNASASATRNFYWYTVKENDNLWRIAEAELGNGGAWAQLKELNKDILKGGENVRPQMRIRVPARGATASVN